MDNELLYEKIDKLEGGSLWPGGIEDKPDAFDLQPPSLRDVSRLPSGMRPGQRLYQGSLT